MNKIFTILIIAFLACFLACKKTHNTPGSSSDFLKVFNVHVWSINTGSSATTGTIATDNTGNIYFWYYDSLANPQNRIAIVKTNLQGDVIWKVHFFFYAGSGGLNFLLPVNKNFICSGQYLYLFGNDTSNIQCLLKLNCSDGAVNSKIIFSNILPDSTTVNSIWPSKNGNILLNCTASNVNTNTRPGLSMITTAGTVVWNWYQLPFGNLYNSEVANSLVELTDGSFIFGTMYSKLTDASNMNYLDTRTLKFYHLSSSGTLTRNYTLSGGSDTQSTSGISVAENVDATKQFSLFSNPGGGYYIISTVYYNKNTFAAPFRIKLLKTDDSFRVTNTSYISLPSGNTFISSAIQKADGNILVSVFDNSLVAKVLYKCTLYNVAPDASSSSINDLPLSYQSIFITDINQINDGHLLFTGVLRTYATDTDNVFLMKTDNSVHL